MLKECNSEVWPESALGVVVPLYNVTVWLIRDRNDYSDALAVFGIEMQVEGKPAGLVDSLLGADDGRLQLLVGWFDGRRGTFAHEIAHAAFAVCKFVGIPTPCTEANEAYCYIVGWLTDALDEKIDEYAKL